MEKPVRPEPTEPMELVILQVLPDNKVHKVHMGVKMEMKVHPEQPDHRQQDHRDHRDHLEFEGVRVSMGSTAHRVLWDTLAELDLSTHCEYWDCSRDSSHFSSDCRHVVRHKVSVHPVIRNKSMPRPAHHSATKSQSRGCHPQPTVDHPSSATQ